MLQSVKRIFGGRAAGGTLAQGAGQVAAAEENGIHELMRRADRGDRDAMFEIGLAYMRGSSVVRCPGDAAVFFVRAAEAGHAEAAFQLAALHHSGKGRLEPDSALRLWQTNATEGNPVAAESNIRLLFPNGLEIPHDPAESVRWLQRAGELGHAVAQYNIGSSYLRGANGLTVDNAVGVSWLERAAEQNNVAAIYDLALIFHHGQCGQVRDLDLAAQFYRRAAEQGHAAAQLNLGVMYTRPEGVPLDYEEAKRWFTAAAEQGDATAQMNLGLMHHLGQGGDVDHAAALHWFMKASEAGEARAGFMLGTIYIQGVGVVKDPVKAAEYFRRAAERNDRDAQFNLGQIYAGGIGFARDVDEAVRWFALAAAQGHQIAQYNLAMIHARGLVEGADLSTAVEHFKRAALSGHGPSQHMLATMLLNGQGCERNPVEARSWLLKAAEQRQPGAMIALADLQAAAADDPQALVRAYAWLLLAQSFAPAGADHAAAEERRQRLATRLDADRITEAEGLVETCRADGMLRRLEDAA